MKRNSQRGSAMLITLILMAALLAGAAVLVSLQLAANKNTELTKTGMTALYCAEAGLTITRATISANQENWPAALALGALADPQEPSWLSGLDHNVDDDTNLIDYKVWLEDNYDETTGADDPATDKDNRIYIVSRCIDPRFEDTPREIRELVQYSLITNCYNAQRGGCGGNGNMN